MKTDGWAKFSFLYRGAIGIHWISRIGLHANRRPKTPAPKPPKISRTIVIRSFFCKTCCQKVIHTRPPKFKKWQFRYSSDYKHFFNKMASKKQFHHSVPLRILTDSKTLKLVEIIWKNIKMASKKMNFRCTKKSIFLL